jgi:hypothetical protein
VPLHACHTVTCTHVDGARARADERAPTSAVRDNMCRLTQHTRAARRRGRAEAVGSLMHAATAKPHAAPAGSNTRLRNAVRRFLPPRRVLLVKASAVRRARTSVVGATRRALPWRSGTPKAF